MTTMHTPWGPPQDIEELAEGVLRVSTASHGGLKLSRERWAEIPAAVRDAMFTPTFAEEDCEELIVRTLLGLGDDREREIWRSGWQNTSSDTLPRCPISRERGWAMSTTTRPRPRSLPSTTTKLQTEYGNLYVTVSTDEDGEPFEVFGWLGKGGSFQHGVTELACRLISLHMRRGTPLEEVIDQCQGIQEMQPFFNTMPDGRSVAVLGLGDGIAHILKAHVKAGEEREAAETAEAVEAKAAA